jgi:hypothetical protein
VRDHVLISGHDEHYPEGSYYLAWYEHGERHGKAVPDFATVAEAARLKAFEVEALKAGSCRANNRSPEKSMCSV